MSTSNRLRTTARKIKLKVVRALHGFALVVSSPYDFMLEVQSRFSLPPMANYLRQGGIDLLFGALYELSASDLVLRTRILEGEIGNAFRQFYPLALSDEKGRTYLAARGVDDLYHYVHAYATKLGLPLAQRMESFAQEGEDLILSRMFGSMAAGFYVDVGAHHPFRFSNTYLLYLRGWRGINIDAMAATVAAFQHWRPDDINIECLVSSSEMNWQFFEYDEPALNTMSVDLVRRRQLDAPQYRVVRTITLRSRRLDALLAEHLPTGQRIDILNVDVEGHDLEVLKSNDWSQFRPRVIVVELLALGLEEMQKTDLYLFLSRQGYRLQSKLVNSAIFVE